MTKNKPEAQKIFKHSNGTSGSDWLQLTFRVL